MMSVAERLSRGLLRLYPRRFRVEYGDDVIAFVRARASEPRYATRAGRLRLTVHVVADGLAGAAREQCSAVLNRHRLPMPAASTAALPSNDDPPEELMVTLLQDVRYALRTLRRRPAFTIVAAVTLSLGIGATAAIFGFVDVLMFRPLRYPASHELVAVTMTRGRSLREPAAYPDFVDWRTQAKSFQALAVARWQSVNLTGGDAPERLSGNFASASLLTMLGAEPIAGRLFLPPETEVGTAQPVAVVSEGLWRRRYGAAPDLVGQVMVLNGQPFTVIGIVPS
ncbi:MAG TPA: ABC transporter permease, partial [Gemmatimonadaceae bacterium]|nr:ABC transporter permease [Gemmatimonadaceae bacterium]